MKRSIKEIALELLEKYQDEAESVNYERGTLADEAELAEEIKRYKEEIEEADHESR
jgi:ribosomal protein S17E